MPIKLTKNKQNELLKAGFKLGWQNIFVIARLTLPVFFPLYLVYYFSKQDGHSPFLLLLHIICVLVNIILIPASTIISNHALNQKRQGHPVPTLAESWEYCLARLLWYWKVLGKSVLMILKGLFPKIVPGIRLAIQYTLVMVIVSIEPPAEKADVPLRTSQELIKGQEWAILRLMVLSYLLIFLLVFCISLPLALIETFWMNAVIDSTTQFLVAPFLGMLLLLYQTLKEELPEGHETLLNKN